MIMNYDPVGFFRGSIEIPETAKLGLEFVFIKADDPDFTNAVDPIVDISEDEESIYLSSLGIYSIIQKQFNKNDLLAYQLRKFQRDSDLKTPPPIGKNIDMKLLNKKVKSHE